MPTPLTLEEADSADDNAQATAVGDSPEIPTGGGDAEASLTQPTLGAALRRIRRHRGLSLGQVAAGTEVSASFLALVEKGRSDIAIGRLMRILHFYEASVTDLVPNGTRGPDEIVVRRGDARKIRSADGVELYLLAPDTNRAMMPVLTTFEPHTRLTDLEPHDGETFIHILEGVILFEMEGVDPIVLHPGDTAYYKPRHAPDLTNLAAVPARLIGTVTPPIL